MNRSPRQYKPKSAWPKRDLTLWDAAYKSGPDPFEDYGAAAHHSPRTKLQLEYAYGKFLYFLSERHRELLSRAPGAWISPKIIEDAISNRIRAQAKRQPEKHHLVASETLYALGTALMDQIVAKTEAAVSVFPASVLRSFVAQMSFKHRHSAVKHCGSVGHVEVDVGQRRTSICTAAANHENAVVNPHLHMQERPVGAIEFA
jgi:hypothetical protein